MIILGREGSKFSKEEIFENSSLQVDVLIRYGLDVHCAIQQCSSDPLTSSLKMWASMRSHFLNDISSRGKSRSFPHILHAN